MPLIAGWGETYYGQTELTEWLMWARTVVEGKQCEGLRGRICAIDFPKFKSGVCHGDSGGPLLTTAPHGQGLIEIGITQAVFGRCSTRRPGVFTRADLICAMGRSLDLNPDPPILIATGGAAASGSGGSGFRSDSPPAADLLPLR